MFYLLFLIGVFLSVIAQIFLKTGANANFSGISAYMNRYVITGYILFFISMIIIIIAYRDVPLKYGQILNASGFLILPIISKKVFRETISRRKLIGIFMITLGIFVFTI